MQSRACVRPDQRLGAVHIDLALERLDSRKSLFEAVCIPIEEGITHNAISLSTVRFDEIGRALADVTAPNHLAPRLVEVILRRSVMRVSLFVRTHHEPNSRGDVYRQHKSRVCTHVHLCT